MPLSEFDIIRRYFSAIGTLRSDVRVGVGDDGAVVTVPPGQELVVAVDTLVEGRHFFTGAAAEDIGYKSLAVNLSDLAAMGAEPAWFTLALSLPAAEPGWLQAFASGLTSLARRFNLQLVGGDTTRGPLMISITVGGYVPSDTALLRSGARPGDAVFVSGTLGDAACCLKHAGAGAGTGGWSTVDEFLRGRLDRPDPRIPLGLLLRGRASACIDISDGFAADLGHVLQASQCGAQINVDALPVSDALRAACSDRDERLALMLSGGDDYELCFCVPREHETHIYKGINGSDCKITKVGNILESGGLQLVYDDGTGYTLQASEFDHFQGSSA